MSAWGPTEGYQQGAGFPRELNTWSRDQMIQALGAMIDSRNISNEVRDQILYYYRQMMNGGYTSPEEINAIGQRIMPWVDQVMNDRQGRLGQINDMWGNRQTADQAFSPIYDRFNDQAGDIVRTGEMNAGEIDNTFGRSFDRAQGANQRINDTLAQGFGSINSGINNTFGSLRSANARTGSDLLNATNGAYSGMRDASGNVFGGLERDSDRTYGDLMGQAAQTYGGLQGQSEQTYDDVLSEIEKLRPGSEFAAAKTTRAWAPTVAAANQRLRRMNVQPTDLAGAALLSGIEGDRARAVDDAMTTEMGNFADRRNNALVARQSGRERLGLGRLGYDTDARLGQQAGRERLRVGNLMNQQGLGEREQEIGRGLVESGLMRDINLGIGQHDRTAASTASAMQAANAEQARNLAALTGLDMGRAQAMIQNTNQGYDRTAAWRGGLNQTDLARFGANRDDMNTSMNLLREQNAEDMVRHGLMSDRYSAGQNWQNNNLSRQDQGAANLMNIWSGANQQAAQQAGQAFNWGRLGMDAANQARENDAGRGGWGWNLIGAAASMIPGIGPALSQGLGGMGRANGSGGGAAGQYGVGGGFNLQPVVGQFQNWMNNRNRPQFNQGGWDYINSGGYR